MGNKLLCILFFAFAATGVFAQPTNDNCASATTLVSGAAPTCAQTTNLGTVQAGEVTATASTGAASAFSQTVWYKFVATSSSMYVQWEFTGLVSGSTWCPTRVAMVVYNTATCVPAASSIIASEALAADGAIVIDLTGLTVGNTYLVQVGYNDGAGCKIPVFCMSVGNEPTPCSCTSPCAAGCGYATAPSVSTVTSTCPEYVLTPVDDGGETTTYCYTFTAASTSVSFSMVITSNCSGGNVSALTWTLQTTSCGATVASGTLSSLSAPTVVGTTYVLCYTYTIPSGCHHSGVYPYFVGASPLSIELLSFDVKKGVNRAIIDWSTASETNNHSFTIEKSTDGQHFDVLSRVDGAGTSLEVSNYSVTDPYPVTGINYYRLRSTDNDGVSTYSETRTLDYEGSAGIDVLISPNPVHDGLVQFDITGDIDQTATLNIFDVSGKLVCNYQLSLGGDGRNKFTLNNAFQQGVYLVQICSGGVNKSQKLVIN